MRADAPCDLHIPFLRFDRDPPEDTLLHILDQNDHADAVQRIEAAMAAVAVPGDGALRVAVVGALPDHRTIFHCREPIGDGLLADALGAVAGRPYGPDDIVFLHADDDLLWYCPRDDDALHLAVHNVACLVAATAPPRARDTLYLAVCATILLSLGLSIDAHRRLTDEILEMWVRDKLGGGDPREWDEAALERVRAADPWAATFMEGLGAAVAAFRPLPLPAPLWTIAEAARALQAQATLAEAETVGQA